MYQTLINCLFVYLLVLTGVHNARVLEKEISESFGQDILDCCGADFLRLHQVFSTYITNNIN